MTDVAVKMPARGLSPSQLETWESCRFRWYAKYAMKIPDPPGPEARRGTMTHAVLEEVSKLPPGERTLDAALGYARQLWAGDPVEMRRSAWQHVCTALRNVEVSHGQVLGCEVRLKATVAGVKFNGIADRIDQLPSGTAAIRDYKSGKRPGRRDWLEPKRLQVLLYAVAYEEQTGGHRVDDVALIWTGPDGGGRVDRWDVTDIDRAKAEGALTRVWGEMQHAVNLINGVGQLQHLPGNGPPPVTVAEAFPAKPGGLCSWCPALEHCPKGVEHVREQSRDPRKRAKLGPRGVKLLENEIVQQMEAQLAANQGQHLTAVAEPVPRAAKAALGRVRRVRPLS